MARTDVVAGALLTSTVASRGKRGCTNQPAWSVDTPVPASGRVGWQPSHFLSDRAEAER